MSGDDLTRTIEQYHHAVDAIMRGDAEPSRSLYSRGDDATLANPLGPPVRGYAQITQALERAAAQMHDGEPKAYERITEYATPELAYIVEIERNRVKVGGADEFAAMALRVTTIFRREDDGWRLVHRHADPTTAPRAISSVVQG
jgi:ketosteroid isomerase-like protein